MPDFKAGRLAEDIKREISALIRELKDPRISSMLSVVKVTVSGDKSHCKVYVSALEGYEKSKESVQGLESASGYIKRALSNKLHLRKSPELKFIADNSIEESTHINKIIENLNK